MGGYQKWLFVLRRKNGAFFLLPLRIVLLLGRFGQRVFFSAFQTDCSLFGSSLATVSSLAAQHYINIWRLIFVRSAIRPEVGAVSVWVSKRTH